MRQGDEDEEEEEGEHSNELTALLSLERCSNTTIDRQRLSLSLSLLAIDCLPACLPMCVCTTMVDGAKCCPTWPPLPPPPPPPPPPVAYSQK